ncbi:MAG: TolC family protein [Burkholderiales bacterium]|nr:TolC family protein [Burkholderiales bacterium]
MKFRPFSCLFAAGVLAVAATLPARAQGAFDPSSLTLEAAEARLATRNREIALARRALEQSRAEVMVAGQRPNPQLSFTVQNINPNRGIGGGDWRGRTVDSIVRVDQLIERGGKSELRVETAQRLAAAAGEDLAEVTRQQTLVLRNAYYDLLAAQEKEAAAAEAAQLFDRTVEAAQTRLRAGDIAASDLSRIRVDALRARNEARAAAGEAARARLDLAHAIGADADPQLLRAVSPWPPRDDGQSWSEVQLEARGDVRAARARVAAADKARDLAQASRSRDVLVGAQYEHWPNRADANNQGTGNSFGVALSVPLFLRHRYEGEIARAQADWYAARDQLELVLATARTEVARASAGLAAARDRLSRLEVELLPEAARTMAAAEFAYRNGASGVMDLLDARRVMRAVQSEAAAARAEYAKARAAFALGRGEGAAPDREALR